MFSITDNERLRDAYALLMFMQSDIPASAEKRAAVKNLAATIKREIRNYNNRPVPDVHIICADYDGLLLVQLGVHALSGAVVGDKRADQAQTAGDQCHNNRFAHAPSRRRVRPFALMIRG